MENYLKIAQRADYAFGFLFAALAIYFAVDHNALVSVICALSAAVSFASAKFMPAKWLAKRLLLARLKS